MKPGDLIWQRRVPGGECLVIEVWDDRSKYTNKLNERVTDAGECIWAPHDFPILTVLHPTEGLITDPGYYYETLEDAIQHANRMTIETGFQWSPCQ